MANEKLVLGAAKVDVKSAIAHLEEQTGEKISYNELAKRAGVSRNNLPKWEVGEALKTVEGVVAISKVTGYPIQKLIIEK